jgi:hypothetical protein
MFIARPISSLVNWYTTYFFCHTALTMALKRGIWFGKYELQSVSQLPAPRRQPANKRTATADVMGEVKCGSIPPSPSDGPAGWPQPRNSDLELNIYAGKL